MRTIHRVALLTVLATFVPALAACSADLIPTSSMFSVSARRKSFRANARRCLLVVFRACPKVVRRNT